MAKCSANCLYNCADSAEMIYSLPNELARSTCDRSWSFIFYFYRFLASDYLRLWFNVSHHLFHPINLLIGSRVYFFLVVFMSLSIYDLTPIPVHMLCCLLSRSDLVGYSSFFNSLTPSVPYHLAFFIIYALPSQYPMPLVVASSPLENGSVLQKERICYRHDVSESRNTVMIDRRPICLVGGVGTFNRSRKDMRQPDSRDITGSSQRHFRGQWQRYKCKRFHQGLHDRFLWLRPLTATQFY